jgi:hypothetical protein
MTKTRDLRALFAVLVRPAIAQMQLVQTKDVTVPGKMTAPPYDVDTGIELNAGDKLVVSASGSFWPGCVFCPSVQPQGNDKLADNHFPAPGKPEWSLLGKVGGGQYFYIGDSYEGVPQGSGGELYLRINDDKMDDNTGSYVAHIRVYRDDSSSTPPPPVQCSDGKDNDGDGKIDFGTGPNNDPGCTSAQDNDETDTVANTAPKIDPLKPAPGSKIHNSSPLIAANVSDAETDLAQGDIKLFVDGRPVTNFSYDAATDRLSYRSGKLAYGGHTVKVEATDASALMGENTWKFKVVKR